MEIEANGHDDDEFLHPTTLIDSGIAYSFLLCGGGLTRNDTI